MSTVKTGTTNVERMTRSNARRARAVRLPPRRRRRGWDVNGKEAQNDCREPAASLQVNLSSFAALDRELVEVVESECQKYQNVGGCKGRRGHGSGQSEVVAWYCDCRWLKPTAS